MFNSTKKEVLFGLIASLALLAVSYVLGLIFWITPPGMYVAFALPYITHLIFYPVVGYLVLIIIFPIINSIVLFFVKNLNIRHGLKLGYGFLLIFVIIIASSYIKLAVGMKKQEAYNETKKQIESGDVSICDKMVVEEGYENRVPSTKQVKESCYLMVVRWAVETGDASNCDRLINSLPAFNSCVLQIAQKNKDTNICNKLGTKTLVENCYLLNK